jgi:hypothetical protein
MVAGSVHAYAVSMLWPERPPPPPAPRPAGAGGGATLGYGVRVGAAGASAAAIGFLLDFERVGWACAAALLVMRPAHEMQRLRSAARLLAVAAGALVAIALLRAEPAIAWYAPVVIAVIGAAAATRASRWYVPRRRARVRVRPAPVGGIGPPRGAKRPLTARPRRSQARRMGSDRIGRLMKGVFEDPRSPQADAHPRRGVTILTCMDPRLEPEQILGLQPGDATVIRNAGGAVTDDVVQSIGISQRILGTRAIIVLHHTGCTGTKTRVPGVRAETALHNAVEALRHDARLVHRDRVSGALYDTVGRALLHAPRPEAVRDHDHAHAHPAAAKASSHRGESPAAARAHRCAWCGRPFGGVATARRDARRRYCGDLCRIAARRGARGAHGAR